MKTVSLALFILVGVAVGVAGGMQALINSNLNKTADLPLTTLVVNLVSAITILLVYLMFSRQSLSVLRQADWYAFTGGLLGVIVVMGSTFLIPRMGITIASSVIIVSQLTLSMVADHYGFFGVRQIPIDPMRVGAVSLMILGLYLFFK